MERAAFEELVQLMERMAGGDVAAVVELVDRFRPALARAVRGHLRDLGVAHPPLSDVDVLVLDAALALFDIAGSWRADRGALPWQWAHHRIRSVVSAFVGVHATSVEAPGVAERLAARPAVALPPVDDDEVALLDALARRGGLPAVLHAGLERVASTRDRGVFLLYVMQQATGDRSPAVTVAARFGLRPDAVRQIKRRVTTRLQALGHDDPGFAALTHVACAA